MTDKEAEQIATKHKLRTRGFAYPVWTVQAARRTNLPLSQALALLQKESGGGANVFGHDPTTSIPDRWKGGRVTKWRYWWYKRHRASKGMQGVGPCQLTWWQTQDAADRAGGCWRPYTNMVIAFEMLSNLIAQHGVERGAAAYNGSGPAAAIYGRDFVRKANFWHATLQKD